MVTTNRLIGGLVVLFCLGIVVPARGGEAAPAEPNPPPAAAPMPDNSEGEAAAALLESAYQGRRPPEAVRMLLGILRGSRMGPGEGWFGPADTRYTWKWLAAHCGVDPAAGAIPRDRFPGPEARFGRLDRNHDGVITPADLDWSERNPSTQMSFMANRLFRKLNTHGDGRLTKEEIVQFFDRAAQGKQSLSFNEFCGALLGGWSGGFQPGDAPASPAVLVRGLFANEIGSLNEGPRLGQPAPNFALKTVDGKETVQLTNLIGTKPLILVFGNFTCGPFRSFYPDVDEVYQRYKDEARFLMVYVREAHPTDGWKMESNSRAGITIKQPATIEARVAVAGQFCSLLKPTLPVVVDEINDPVGNAYSGMPARLYVIDAQGKVAYKSGRGPFGFRAGEMEQALVMALLEQQKSGRSSAAKASSSSPAPTRQAPR